MTSEEYVERLKEVGEGIKKSSEETLKILNKGIQDTLKFTMGEENAEKVNNVAGKAKEVGKQAVSDLKDVADIVSKSFTTDYEKERVSIVKSTAYLTTLVSDDIMNEVETVTRMPMYQKYREYAGMSLEEMFDKLGIKLVGRDDGDCVMVKLQMQNQPYTPFLEILPEILAPWMTGGQIIMQSGDYKMFIKYEFDGKGWVERKEVTPDDFLNLKDEPEHKQFLHPEYLPINKDAAVYVKLTDAGIDKYSRSRSLQSDAIRELQKNDMLSIRMGSLFEIFGGTTEGMMTFFQGGYIYLEK